MGVCVSVSGLVSAGGWEEGGRRGEGERGGVV